MNPEKNLATHVILQAAKDFIDSFKDGDCSKKNATKCYRFLTGKTQTDVFWFEVACIHPFENIGKNALYQKLENLWK